ncbi:MAG: sensor histidine kinase [Atopobiaceae bacterium]
MSAHRLQQLLFGGADATVRGMRRKVTVMALLACTLVLALVLVGINLLNWTATVRRLDTELDYLEDTDGELSALLSDSDGSSPDYLMEVPYDTRYFVVTLDMNGEPLALNMDSIASVHDEGAVEMAQDAVASGNARGFAGSYRYRVVAAVGQTTVFFLYAYNDLAYFHSFLMASIAMGLLGLAAFILIVFPFSSAAIRPVEEAQKQQRRFVTDASHELRTPLSIIQSAVDVIEIENGESEWTESIHNQTKRLEGLTNKLVALAKADEGAGSLKISDVDLSQLAMEVAEDFEAVSAAQEKPFTTDIQEGIVVRADAGMAGQIISILLDNAFKHSPDGAAVALSVKQKRPGHAEILVENTAEGIAPGPHPELFDRFFKADPSRTYEGGHGIGLAVVKAAAKAHGGSAEAVSDGGTLAITVEL